MEPLGIFPQREPVVEDWHRREIDGVVDELLKRAKTATSADAADKDKEAYLTLLSVSRLIVGLAGWAIDHTVGLAAEGLSPVYPVVPDEREKEPYLTEKTRADNHRHQVLGAAIRQGSAVLPSGTARLAVINLLEFSGLGLPETVSHPLVEGLKALEFERDHPFFRTRRRRRISYSIMELQIKAIGFVHFRNALGDSRETAQSAVAQAYGVSDATVEAWVKKWKERSPSEAGEAQRTRGRARSHARQKLNMSNLHDPDREFGDYQLTAAGRLYRKLNTPLKSSTSRVKGTPTAGGGG